MRLEPSFLLYFLLDSQGVSTYNHKKCSGLGEIIYADSPPIKQELLLQIDRLPDYKLQEVLDFVEFLLFKDQAISRQPTMKPTSQPEILPALTRIRETAQQTYGVYQGDLLAEARAEREQLLSV